MVQTERPADQLSLPEPVIADIREALPEVAEDVVAAVVAGVPSYQDALSGPMGEKIRQAVEVALGGFLTRARGRIPRHAAAGAPAKGAYELGRGEARSGRTTEALLAAYRVGAREAWRQLAARAAARGLDAEQMARFAELVFAYIDELSDASAAGHADEMTAAGRVRQRRLERLARSIVEGAPAEVLHQQAVQAEWEPPTTLTAVLVSEAQVRPVLAALPPQTLTATDLPEVGSDALLLVPDMHDSGRGALLRTLEGRGALAGPARPWQLAGASCARVVRARELGIELDTEEHLPELVVHADPAALADLRERVLAPLATVRPSTAEKLAETLRAWLLHHGRREEIAAALFVHPQTVRYRLSQLRDLYGDRLEDPDTVLALTLALGVPSPPG